MRSKLLHILQVLAKPLAARATSFAQRFVNALSFVLGSLRCAGSRLRVGVTPFVEAAYTDPRWKLATFMLLAAFAYIGTTGSMNKEIDDLNRITNDFQGQLADLEAAYKEVLVVEGLLTEFGSLGKAYTGNFRSVVEAMQSEAKGPDEALLLQLLNTYQWAADLRKKTDLHAARLEGLSIVSLPEQTRKLVPDAVAMLQDHSLLLKDIEEQGQAFRSGDPKRLLATLTTMTANLDVYRQKGEARVVSLEGTARTLFGYVRTTESAIEDYQRRTRWLWVQQTVFYCVLAYFAVFLLVTLLAIWRLGAALTPTSPTKHSDGSEDSKPVPA